MSRIVMACALGVIVAAVGGVAYAMALVSNPNAMFGVVLPLIYGATIGGLTARIGTHFGIRRLTAFGAALAMLGYGISWAPWVWWTLSRSGHPVALVAVLDPSVSLRLLQVLYTHGAWTIRGDAVAGPSLAFVWILEALVVVGASAFAAFTVGVRAAATK